LVKPSESARPDGCGAASIRDEIWEAAQIVGTDGYVPGRWALSNDVVAYSIDPGIHVAKIGKAHVLYARFVHVFLQPFQVLTPIQI
jgi:hypothetical protein